MSEVLRRVRAAALPSLLLLVAPPPAAGEDPGPFADLSGEWNGTIQVVTAPACTADFGGRTRFPACSKGHCVIHTYFKLARPH